MFSWWCVQALASCRIRVRMEQAMSGPCPHGIRRDAKSLGYLLVGEKPRVAQSFITALERLMVFDEISDHLPRKESPVTGAMPVLVEDRRNAARRVRLKQRIDLGHDRRARLLQFPCAQWDGQGERSRTPAAEAHICRDGVASVHCDLFDQQTDPAFSLACWCLRIAPQPWEIGGQCQYTPAFLARQGRPLPASPPAAALLTLSDPTTL